MPSEEVVKREFLNGLVCLIKKDEGLTEREILKYKPRLLYGRISSKKISCLFKYSPLVAINLIGGRKTKLEILPGSMLNVYEWRKRESERIKSLRPVRWAQWNRYVSSQA